MEEMKTALTGVIKNVFDVDVAVELTRTSEQFGDYATNAALQLAGRLGRNPREVAEELAGKLREALGDKVRDVSVAGPGFINITLSDAALYELAQNAPATKPQTHKGKVVVAEYSDPNTFKELHAGHFYTTIVGDAIARLFEVSGAKVHRINFGADVGLPVARAMWGIIRHLGGEHPEKLAEVSESDRPNWLSQRYVEGATADESDETAKAEIREINKRVYDLHTANDRETPFAQIYWTCRQWSYDGFDALYKDLGIYKFDRYIPESEVAPIGMQMATKALKDGVLEQSDGAVVFKGEEHGLHTRVFINSNGLPTYEAKDLGLAELKWRDYQYDKSFIITGNDIVEYMKIVLKVLGHFHPGIVERTTHFTHGMIRLPGGRKMSSRKGNNPKAKDILEAAHEANKQAHDGQDDPRISVGAVKYAFLKHRVGGDIVYDPEESVSLEGNSGPYLQYAHARARSILAKAQTADNRQQITDFDPAERSLARKISEYPEVLQKSVDDLLPHHICTYLYELAQEFNRFYEKSKVVGDPREATRLKLVQLYADILKDGLNLLGIAAPNKM